MASLSDAVGAGNYHFTLPSKAASGVFGGLDLDDEIGDLPGTQTLITSEIGDEEEDDDAAD